MNPTGSRAGAAITITAMTSAVAFLVASSVKIPVIHNFCILSALAVAFELIFKQTLYMAMITYDERRQQVMVTGMLNPPFCHPPFPDQLALLV